MHVVALLSGGKDSCYTLLKCRLHAHTIVALGHITPPSEEPDSFMYQSVGSSTIPLLAEALEIPLFTQPTNAKARNQRLAYTPTADDEVEDLVRLLTKVKQACPSVNAVCAGALWSDYQRLRVENAASRVGLLSLAYLWRRQQSELLDEMIAVGVHAVLIKVAGIGLNSSHLGKSLAQMRPLLRKLEQNYGSHVCGEGGEYETLVLWMPGFKKQLVLKNIEVVNHSDDPVAPVSFLRIVDCELAELSDHQMSVPFPELYEPSEPFVFETEEEDIDGTTANAPEVKTCHSLGELVLKVDTGIASTFMHIVIRSPKDGKEGVIEAAQNLELELEKHGGLASVVYVTLHLQSVKGSKYAEANVGYNTVFSRPECTPPPSRACVGTFSSNHATTLEALVRINRNRNSSDSFTLHVQSLSEWAPPCIGPYAQLVEEDDTIHVCGVLPLHAPSASILNGMSIKKQAELCIYNMQRTLEAIKAELSQLRLFVIYVTKPEYVQPVMEEMDRCMGPGSYICTVIPVRELPKDGKVEIRAVGTKSQALERFVLGGETDRLRIKGITSGALGFVSFSYKNEETGDKECAALISDALATVPFQEGTELLSVQVYTSPVRHAKLQDTLTALLADSSVVCFSAPWLPNDSDVVGSATFAL